MIVVILSQADYDAVDLKNYPAGRSALKAGAISGQDMTLEASLTKLMWLLGNYSEKPKIEELFQQNLAGELS